MMRYSGQRLTDIPPKLYRTAGHLSLLFALTISLPAILQFWGFKLHIPNEILFFIFYMFLNLRFISFLLPPVLMVLKGKEHRRKQRFKKYGISGREQEVYDLLAKAYSYKEISHFLKISLPTVKTHVEHLFRKTESGNKVELISQIDDPD